MSHEALGQSPVSELLAQVASGSLTPGGIGMAALTGALGAALIGFVGRLTAGKPGYEPLTEEMERLCERGRVLEEQLLGLMDQEVDAFNQLARSLGLPRETADEQTVRWDCVRIAARGFAQVPLQLGQLALEALQLAETAIRYGNREVVADGGMAFLALVAAIKGSALQVLINVGAQEEEWAIAAREKVAQWLAVLPAHEAELWPYLLEQASVSGAS